MQRGNPFGAIVFKKLSIPLFAEIHVLGAGTQYDTHAAGGHILNHIGTTSFFLLNGIESKTRIFQGYSGRSHGKFGSPVKIPEVFIPVQIIGQ